MDPFHHIYTHQAGAYHRMIQAEDADGHLLPALLRACPLAGARVLDLGSGTGRIPLLLAPLTRHVVALELQRAMLREQVIQRAQTGGSWPLAQADMRRLPVRDGWADAAIAGWSIGHLAGWHPLDWQAHTGAVLGEMQRATRPGGTLVILETLGTGALSPAPPTPELAEYYAWLESAWGFRREVISTDYQFESAEEATAATEFFFGPGLAAEIRVRGWARLPEWTGVWSKRSGDETRLASNPKF